MNFFSFSEYSFFFSNNGLCEHIHLCLHIYIQSFLLKLKVIYFKDKKCEITTWLGQKWHIGEPGGPAAHPNSRFAAPAGQCPIIHPDWESPAGVPIEAFIFGGRRCALHSFLKYTFCHTQYPFFRKFKKPS